MTIRPAGATLLLLLAQIAAAQTPARPADAGRTVTLPLNEFNRLIDLANRPPQDPPLAPVAAVLANADLQIRVERDSVRGVFTLTGDVLRPGTNRVTLLSGATLLDATMDGRPVPLVADGAAQAALLLGPGPFSVAVDWAGALEFSPGRAAFVLPVPQSGTAHASFDLPGEQADLRLSSGLVTRRTVANGRTLVEATLDPGSSTQVSWSMRDSAPVAAQREVRTLGDVFSLVTIGDSDIRMVTLIDLTVVQGEPGAVNVRLPAGYELTSLTGNTLDTSELRDSALLLTVRDPTARRHQFLLSLERPHDGGSFTLTTGLVGLADVQRERGEIAVEGIGALEATSVDREGLARIDARELNPALRSLSRNPLLSAFRYQGGVAGPPELTLDVKRFGDAGVLAAVADRARATTVVTSEGRALTEVALLVSNRAQPFLKVTLPAGASIVSVDVAGESAKPALGADGTQRVPLLRPGLRPTGPYAVSFVYVHSGAPFTRKGDLNMLLPRMDIPVGLMEWEVFVPNRYDVRQVGGNVIDGNIRLQPPKRPRAESVVPAATAAPPAAPVACSIAGPFTPAAGSATATLTGQVRDASGAAIPGATIEAHSAALIEKIRSVVSDADGRFRIALLPPGTYCVSFALQGFATVKQENVQLAAGATATLRAEMRVGAVSDMLTVVAEATVVDKQNARAQQVFTGNELGDLPTARDLPSLLKIVPSLTTEQVQGICSGGVGVFCNPNAPTFSAGRSVGESEAGGPAINVVPRTGSSVNQGRIVADGVVFDKANSAQAQSANVVNLQRRVAGVLPLRIDVPRAGTSHWFVKPLVVDQEATVTLRYKRR